MYSGSPAAQKVNNEIAGNTLHRRSLVLANLFVDFHIRLATSELGTSSFSTTEFLQGLGAEFGGVDGGVYEEFMKTFVAGAASSMKGRSLSKTPVLYMFQPGMDMDMYKQLGKTRMFALMRFMMGKWCIQICSIF